jgi:hypothetical protein
MEENLDKCIDCELLDLQDIDYEVLMDGVGRHIRHIVASVPEEWFSCCNWCGVCGVPLENEDATLCQDCGMDEYMRSGER